MLSLVNFLIRYILFPSLLFISCKESVKQEVTIAKRNLIDSLVTMTIEKAEILSFDSIDHDKAIAVSEVLMSSSDFSKASKSVRALSYHKLGNFYFRNNQAEQGIVFLDTAIMIRKQFGSKIEKLALANSYYVRSVSYQSSSKYQRALEDVKIAIELISEYPEETLLKGIYLKTAGLHYLNLREMTKAKEYLEQAGPLMDKNSNGLAEYYKVFAQYYDKAGDTEKAIEYYDRSLEEYKLHPEYFENSKLVELDRMRVVTNKLDYPEKKRSYDKFLENFNANTNHLKNAKNVCISNLAYYAIADGYNEDSRAYYLESLDLVKELHFGKNTVDHALAFEGLGDVDAVLSKFESSIAYYHEAIQALSIGFNTEDIYAMPSLTDHVIINDMHLERIAGFKAAAIYSKYQSTKRKEDLIATFKTYKVLDELLTKIRQGYMAAMSRYDLVERTLSYYENATKVAIELYELTEEHKYLEEAYLFASKNKAIVMLDGLQDEAAKFSGVDKFFIEKEGALKKDIYQLDSEIYDLSRSGIESETLLEKKKLRFETVREYEQLIVNLEKDYPDYHALKYAASENVTTETRRKQLPAETAVIEYFVGVDSVYVFSYSQEHRLQVVTIGKPRQLKKALRQFRDLTASDSLYSIAAYGQLSNSIYNRLLKETLKTFDDPISRLFIIPDSEIMLISFEALFTEALDASRSYEWTDSLPYLMRKYAVSYSYSNQLLFDDSSTKRLEEAGAYLGFGLEYDDYTLQGLAALQPTEIDTSMNRGMGKLVYSVDEIKESSKVLGGEYFLNKAATKTKFEKIAESAGILHLAMHGFAMKDNPLNSGMIFSRERRSDNFVLKALDLYTMRLKAGMAVLSACHTGDGTIQKGEGIRSIARAFNYAGCPNVTASLWAATDRSTKDIVVSFFKKVKNGNTLDMALRSAKLDYLDNCQFHKQALPYRWSHLVTIGKTSPIF